MSFNVANVNFKGMVQKVAMAKPAAAKAVNFTSKPDTFTKSEETTDTRESEVISQEEFEKLKADLERHEEERRQGRYNRLVLVRVDYSDDKKEADDKKSDDKKETEATETKK